jgi:hypothetical protein
MSYMKNLLMSVEELQREGLSDPYVIACQLGTTVQLVEDAINTSAKLRTQAWEDGLGIPEYART